MYRCKVYPIVKWAAYSFVKGIQFPESDTAYVSILRKVYSYFVSFHVINVKTFDIFQYSLDWIVVEWDVRM